MSRRTDPVLLSLQAADCIARRLARIGGPRGIRSALAERRGMHDYSDREIDFMLHHIGAVCSISDRTTQRVLALAMETGSQCETVHTVRSMEKVTGIPATTLRRVLKRGLAEVAERLAECEEKMAA